MSQFEAGNAGTLDIATVYSLILLKVLRSYLITGIGIWVTLIPFHCFLLDLLFIACCLHAGSDCVLH
jgi:hypothetical protein